jgi:beta-galactosidase
VLGVRAEELYPLREDETVLLDDGATGTVWTEHLHLEGATALASYVDGPLPGIPAITANRFGKGRGWYVATKLDDPGVARLVDALIDEVGIAPSERPPANVEMVRRRNTDAAYLFVINHSSDEVNLAASGLDLITGRSGPVSVAPGGVAVVKEGGS